MAFNSSDIHINSGSAHEDSIITLMNFNKDSAGNYDFLTKKIVNCSSISPADAATNYITLNTAAGGSITLNKNTIVEGSLTSIDATDLKIADNSIMICSGNTTDVVDGCLYMPYNSTPTKYAGLHRDADDKIFKFFENLEAVPSASVNTATPYTFADAKLTELHSYRVNASTGAPNDALFVAGSGVDTETFTAGCGNGGYAYIQGGTWGGTTKDLKLQEGGGNIKLGMVTSTTTNGGTIQNSNGTNSAPSYSFTTNPDSEMYSGGVGSVLVSTNGSARFGIYDSSIITTVPINASNGYYFLADTDTGMSISGQGKIEFTCDNSQQLAMSGAGCFADTLVGFKGNNNHY